MYIILCRFMAPMSGRDQCEAFSKKSFSLQRNVHIGLSRLFISGCSSVLGHPFMPYARLRLRAYLSIALMFEKIWAQVCFLWIKKLRCLQGFLGLLEASSQPSTTPTTLWALRSSTTCFWASCKNLISQNLSNLWESTKWLFCNSGDHQRAASGSWKRFSQVLSTPWILWLVLFKVNRINQRLAQLSLLVYPQIIIYI